MNVSIEVHAQIDKKIIVNIADIDILCNVSVVEWQWIIDWAGWCDGLLFVEMGNLAIQREGFNLPVVASQTPACRPCNWLAQ